MISSIIAEYNPFHNGHKYHIQATKANGAKYLVVIMSGSIVQRGGFSCLSKWNRALMALKNGADLVLELPTIYCGCNAEIFSSKAVYILDKLGCINQLSFGSEIGEVNSLINLSKITMSLKDNLLVKQKLQSGISYPSAISLTIKELYGEFYYKTITSPNNILATEYIKAILNLKSNIYPYTIKRNLVDHDQQKTYKYFASAMKIREMLNNNDSIVNLIPENTIDIISLNNNIYKNISILENIILYKLRTINVNDLLKIQDISEGLQNRIIKYSRIANSYSEFLACVKTKRYTMSRLRRIMVHLTLGITKNHICTDPSYARILGFNDNGKKIIKKIKSNSNIYLSHNFKKIENLFYEQAKFDRISSDILNVILKNNLDDYNEYTKKPIIV